MPALPVFTVIQWDELSEESVLTTPLGANLFRMEESAVIGEAVLGDVIETMPGEDGRVRFVRVRMPSELKTDVWLLPHRAGESEEVALFLKGVIEAGGKWERYMGGLFRLHLPPAEFDRFADEFERVIRSAS